MGQKAVKKAGMNAARLERIGDFLSRAYVEPGKIPGCQVLVSRHGHVAYRKALGSMDLARGKAWADDTVLRIYSMTKPIVSIALMQLFEQGAFQLDEPIAKAFPAFADLKVWTGGAGEDMVLEPPRKPVTYRQVLSHTAGFTYGGLLVDIGVPGEVDPVDAAYKALRIRRDPKETLSDFMDKLAKAPLRFQPGEAWMYSLATDVCGALVEKHSGQSLDAYLKANIFDPLDMADTGFHVREDQRDRFAANYGRGTDKGLRLLDDPQESPFLAPPVFLSGGGGLVSTLEDYRRFCEMLRGWGEFEGARIIGSRTLDLMTRNHLPGGATLGELAMDGFSETLPAGVGFGLGFAMTLDGVAAGSPAEGEYYWGGAASTAFWIDPEEDMFVIFLTQLMPSTTYNFRGQLRNLVYAAVEE